mmetsp:Transcript_20742/g.42871  ORF Transcript_20742/g.42871 Transcript_20742/m.42871 type:complete len:209 (-) Transcript_20742:100-726(-)
MTTSLSSAAFKSLPFTTPKSSSRVIGASFKISWGRATSCDHDAVKHDVTNATPLDAAPPSTIIRRYYHLQHHRNLPAYDGYDSQINLPLPQQRQNSLYSHHPALTTSQQKRHFAKKTKRHPIPKINKSDFDDYSLRPDDDDDDDEDTSPSDKKILILGSSGTLGKALTKHLSSHLRYHVLGADVVNNTHHALDDEGGLSGYVALPREG